MNKDKEISIKLEEELEGYDEAVVMKIRELYEQADKGMSGEPEDDYKGCKQEGYDLPIIE